MPVTTTGGGQPSAPADAMLWGTSAPDYLLWGNSAPDYITWS